MRIKLASWTPDTVGDPEDFQAPTQQDTKNVYPAASGYAPVKALAALSTTGLDTKALGAFSAVQTDGTVHTFGGTAAKLLLLSGTTFSDVSISGGYNCSERWEFAQFGARIIATEIDDAVQYYDLGSSTLFADLAGSPPKARHIGIVRDFVMLGNTENSSSELYWSGFNDSDQWTKGTNQCDSQTLPDGGWINAIVGGEVGYVFQDTVIRRVIYVGPPTIFQIDVVQRNRGTDAPASVVDVGDQIYFHDHDGFYKLDKASGGVEPIGYQKFDNWFSSHVDADFSVNITSSFDPANKLIYWSFVSTDALVTTYADTALIYNYARGEGAYAKFDHEMLFPALTESLTLEGLSSLYSNLETVPASLDSRVWTGGAAYAAAFTTGHQLAAFTGDTLAATLSTAYFEGVPGRRSMVTEIRPVCDTSAMTAQITSYERLADTGVTTVTAMMQTSGSIPLLSSGRLHSLTLSIPAATAWTFATSVDIDAQDDGEL